MPSTFSKSSLTKRSAELLSVCPCISAAAKVNIFDGGRIHADVAQADAVIRQRKEEIAALEEWIGAGAPDPRVAGAKIGGMSRDEAARWWAFQPLSIPAPPAIPDGPAVQGDLDRFLQARLDAEGLAPAPPADRRTLIRRVTFDLTGLPPAPEEVAAFVADKSLEGPIENPVAYMKKLAGSEHVDASDRQLAIERAAKIDEEARQRGMGGDLNT